MIYILGAGGFAREVLNIIIDLGREEDVLGFVEQHSVREGEVLNDKKVYDEKVLDFAPSGTKLTGAIGSPKRRIWIEQLEQKGFEFETLIHPTVVKSRWVKIGRGSILCAGNVLTNNIEIGNHTIINLGCTVGHDVRMGNYVTVSPGVDISGNVTIEDGVWVGIGSTLIEKTKVGKGSYLGAGACVTKDIPPGVLAVGIPAVVKKSIED